MVVTWDGSSGYMIPWLLSLSLSLSHFLTLQISITVFQGQTVGSADRFSYRGIGAFSLRVFLSLWIHTTVSCLWLSL